MSAAGVLAVMDAYPDLLDFAACHYEAHFKGPGNGGYVPSPHVVAGLAKAAEARAAVAELIEAATRANGDHHTPDDCYATGPLTGNAYRDLVECPGCVLKAALARCSGGAK